LFTYLLVYLLVCVFTCFLFAGVARDGWTISESPLDGSFAITTRQDTACPDQIVTGYDRDLEEDKTFSIKCI
jgi:hypothetical protein